MGKDNRWKTYDEGQLQEVEALAADYKSFMNVVKTGICYTLYRKEIWLNKL